jgi:ubiquinone/menaquinone biosynthesis C-methylase UbiE
MPSISSFAGSVPANYDRFLGPLLFEPYAEEMVERLKMDQLRNVLELACGTGRVTRHLATMILDDGQLLATDVNPDMLELASILLPEEGVQWQVADATSLPFDGHMFDHVICQFGFMFFNDKQKAFQEIYRVLKPGGKLIFSVWDELSKNPRPAIIQQVLLELMGDEAPDMSEKGPYSFFDTDQITSMMTKAGFEHFHFDIVQKSSYYKDVDDIILGFVDGSPLSSFLDKQSQAFREDLIQKLRKALTAQFERYGWEVSMQAIIVEAIK